MKKILLVSMLLLSAAVVWGNGDPVARSSAMRLSRTPVAVHVPEVQLLQEYLDITPMNGYTQVRVRYLLRNTSGKRFDSLPYGFPIDYIGQGPARWGDSDWPISESINEIGWRDDYVRQVSFTLNNRMLPWQCSADTMLHPGRSLLTPEEEKLDTAMYLWEERLVSFLEEDTSNTMGYCEFTYGLYRRWFYTRLTIEPGEAVVLEVDYQLCNGRWGDLYRLGSEFQNTMDRVQTFFYDFTPASYWGDGKAGCFDVLLHTDNFEEGTPYEYFKEAGIKGLPLKPIGNNRFGYSARHFDLAQASPLELSFCTKLSACHHPVADILNHRIDPSLYTVTLSGCDKKYPAANLSDLDLSTATVLRADKDDSLYITIRFKDSMNVTGIAFYNGYCKDSTTYANNSRVRSMMVLAEGRKGYEWRTSSHHYAFCQFTYNMQTKEESCNPDTLRSAIPEAYGWQELTDQALLIPMNNREVQMDDDYYVRGTYAYDYGEYDAVKEIRFSIAEVAKGSKYNDLCISEIIILGGPKRMPRDY